MTFEFLLPLGLWLYAWGAAAHVLKHWSRRGLTDITYGALFLMALGHALVAVWALLEGRPWTAVPVAAVSGMALWLMWLRFRAFVMTGLKTFSRRRRR